MPSCVLCFFSLWFAKLFEINGLVVFIHHGKLLVLFLQIHFSVHPPTPPWVKSTLMLDHLTLPHKSLKFRVLGPGLSPSVLYFEVSTAMSSALLQFSSSASYLSFIPFCVFLKSRHSIGIFFDIFHPFLPLLMTSSTFLNTQNTFLIAAFTFLSSSFIICIMSGSFLVDWTFLLVIFSCSFTCLVISIGCQTLWFYITGGWILLFIPLISVRLCSGMQRGCLESGEFFQALLLSFDRASPEQPWTQQTPCHAMTYVLRDPLCSWWEQEPRHYHFRVVLSPASSGSLSCPGRSVLAKDSQQPPVSPSLLCSLCLPPPLSPSLCASFLLSTSPVLNCPGPSHLWSSYPQLRETAGMSGGPLPALQPQHCL